MGFDLGKALGGAAALSGFVPGGQAFAGVLGAAATAFAEPEGIVYLSPYLDATIPAPFGFPSAPAALTRRPESQPAVASKVGTLSQLFGAALPAGPARALHRLKAGERAPFAPPPGKPNLAGLLRAASPALKAHPQFMAGQQVKWTDEQGWVERVARLRAGIALDADGFDPSWAFYDDPPTAGIVPGAKSKAGTYLRVQDFAPPIGFATALGAFTGDMPENLAGVPYEKLAAHVDRNLKRAREYVSLELSKLEEELELQAQLDAQLRAIQEQYTAHVQAALANGVPLVPAGAFIAGSTLQPAQILPPTTTTPGTTNRSAADTGASAAVVPGALTLAGLIALLVL